MLIYNNGCEEEFEPYTDYDEKYILHCILRGDTNYQTLVLTKSYFTTEPQPINYKIDPAVENATIRLWYGDSVKFFTQTSGTRMDSSRYGSNVIFYENKNFTPLTNTEYEIQATLSNGRKLSGKTIFPGKINFNFMRCDTIIPSSDDKKITVVWNDIKNSLYRLSRFTILYSKFENNSWKRYVKIVPQDYMQKDDKYYPNYSKPKFYSSALQIDNETFHRAMNEISEGDPNKSNYKIWICCAEIIAYDENLSKYYSAQKNTTNNYGVSFSSSNYSNIDGGIGIFGSYSLEYYYIKIKNSYIKSFEYIPGIDD